MPREPGQKRASLVQVDASGNQIALKPTCDLGPTVVSDDARGQLGTVMPNRWNPLEGSSNGAAQVSVRGNTDFQSMLRTFPFGFHEDGRRDELRDSLLTESNARQIDRETLERFEADLAGMVADNQAWRASRRLPEKTDEEIIAELRKSSSDSRLQQGAASA